MATSRHGVIRGRILSRGTRTLNKIIIKNFRPEPPPSVDRPFFISGVVPS